MKGNEMKNGVYIPLISTTNTWKQISAANVRAALHTKNQQGWKQMTDLINNKKADAW